VSLNPPAGQAAMNAMMQTGHALAQQFFEFLAKQQTLLAPTGLPSMVPGAAAAEDSRRLAGLQEEFARRHAELWQAFANRQPDAAPAEPLVAPAPGDRRFAAPEWAQSPYFDYLRQAYLLNAQFLERVADAMPVSDGRAKDRLKFLTRQYVDAMAPSNFAATNPEFIKTALETKGESITRGIQNMLEDLRKGRISMTDDAVFEVGRNLATTAGQVVYENDLMQLIQYAPLTDEVYERPLLIVPPCINKFYIMDLGPENSLVKFIVEQGYTVFLVSWKNAKAEEAHYGWDDYLDQGPITALRLIGEITGCTRPNALAFCVGGTILASALAVLRGRGEDPVASVTLMTTLLDFNDTGEIGCLVDEALVAAREATIGRGGLLFGRELAQTFSALRANDLIWNYVVGNYLKGNKPAAFDLLYWNSDSTNLPGPFLAWYLRHMYLQNELRIPGRLEMLGVKVDLRKVEAPAYVLATREDHIVPWKSAFLAQEVLGGPTTFVLGASGHIAGAINPASRNRRSYWTRAQPASSADEWLGGAEEHKGSWWNHWATWMAPHGGGKVPARVKLGSAKYRPIEPAPGRYVKESA